MAEAQARCSAREFAEWQAFYELEPFGDWRADLRMGILASAMFGCHGASAAPKDFMPDFDETRPAGGQTDEDMRALVEAWARR